MEAQEYPLKSNVVYQNNQNTISMDINSRSSCTGSSHHIYNRYFFVKDRKDKGKFSIDYYLTWKILADYFTNQI